MAKIRLRVKRGDQKPFTRGNPRKCSIATAAKRQYGGSAVVGGSTAKIRGRYYVLGSDAQSVVADHDGGSRVGSRTVTLYGKPMPDLEEQAEAAKKARDARKQARAARKAKAAEAAEQARKQAAERPDPRQQARTAAREQPRAAERPRTAADERAARERARIQEAEARGRLRAAEQVRTAPPRTAQTRARVPAEQSVPQPSPAARQAARAPQPRTPREQSRAIEPPKPVALRWLLRNPFAARPEPEAQPARTRRTA